MLSYTTNIESMICTESQMFQSHLTLDDDWFFAIKINNTPHINNNIRAEWLTNQQKIKTASLNLDKWHQTAVKNV